MNAIGADTVQILQAGLAEAAANFSALVVGNDAANFSAGANLMLVLVEAQEGNWDEIDLMVRMFQKATMSLRYSPVPVVVAPAGLALGGGCEFVLHGDRVQAAAETYMGLVEVGVGLIPAGGGTKEMVQRAWRVPQRAQSRSAAVRPGGVRDDGAREGLDQRAHARQLGYLHDHDPVSMNRERLIADAKALALDRVREGYQAPAPARRSGRRREDRSRTEARRAPGLARGPGHRSRRRRRAHARAHRRAAAHCPTRRR